MHIEISEVRVTRDQILARRQHIAERLERLQLIDRSKGAIVEPEHDEMLGYRLTVGGVELPVPVAGFEVVSTEDGPAVTVTIPASRISIGEQTQAPAPPAQDKPQPVAVWGSVKRDPREGMPGWRPESLGEQVASNAERQSHDHTLKTWTCGCDPTVVGLMEAAQKTGNIEVRGLNIDTDARGHLKESMRSAMRRNGTVGA